MDGRQWWSPISPVWREVISRNPLIHQVHQKMQDLLRKEGAHLDGIYYCPHHPDIGVPPYRQKCRCRKPATGLIEEAVKELDLDLFPKLYGRGSWGGY